MILVKQIKCTLDEECTKERIARKLRCPVEDISSFKLRKESIDARKGELFFIYSALVEISIDEKKYLRSEDVSLSKEEQFQIAPLKKEMTHQPVVVGFGPSGMFAALLLAEAGCKPIVIEQGGSIEERVKDVNAFWQSAKLNPKSNVQFGEGGAGTFSDGKLTTRIKDIRVTKVIAEFIKAGAEEKIGYEAHPHIGTDQLRTIVKNIREKIKSLGGEVHFNTQFEKLVTTDQCVTGIIANGKEIKTETVFMCAGHSAVDTFRSLHAENVYIEPKGFAVGLRIEHKQEFINASQYKEHAGHPRLKAAEYRMSHNAANGRGVYSFCMCPGGFVIPSASSENSIVVNGMSENARNQENANSAVVVQVPVEDFYVDSPFDGFTYQENLEKKAYELGQGNYKAPVQLVEDYLSNKVSTAFNGVHPSYCLGTTFANLNDLFSPVINAALLDALAAFNKKINGFTSHGALLTGVETRSSSPVRLLRNENLESVNTAGLYPCGEGAGYAGGIVSSAVDGIRCAERFIEKIR